MNISKLMYDNKIKIKMFEGFFSNVLKKAMETKQDQINAVLENKTVEICEDDDKGYKNVLFLGSHNLMYRCWDKILGEMNKKTLFYLEKNKGKGKGVKSTEKEIKFTIIITLED